MPANFGSVEDLHRLIRGREPDFLRSLGIVPPRRGHIRCPFPDHEDRHPSWRLNTKTGRYHCTCGQGDIFEFIQRYRSVGFLAAKSIVSDFVGSAPA